MSRLTECDKRRGTVVIQTFSRRTDTWPWADLIDVEKGDVGILLYEWITDGDRDTSIRIVYWPRYNKATIEKPCTCDLIEGEVVDLPEEAIDLIVEDEMMRLARYGRKPKFDPAPNRAKLAARQLAPKPEPAKPEPAPKPAPKAKRAKPAPAKPYKPEGIYATGQLVTSKVQKWLNFRDTVKPGRVGIVVQYHDTSDHYLVLWAPTDNDDKACYSRMRPDEIDFARHSINDDPLVWRAITIAAQPNGPKADQVPAPDQDDNHDPEPKPGQKPILRLV